MNRTIILGTPLGVCNFKVAAEEVIDFMNIGEGNVAAYDAEGNPIDKDSNTILNGGIQFVGGRGSKLHPAATPILGMRGAQFKIMYPKEGSKFKAILLLTNIDVTKEGVWSILLASIEDPIRNSRYKWNTDVYTDGTKSLEQVADEVVALFNTQNKKNLGVTATRGVYTPKGGQSTPCIKFEADDFNAWAIIPSNNLLYAPLVTAATADEEDDISVGYKPVLDAEFVLNKFRENAAEEGFENIYGDLSEMYPGYNNPQLYSWYALVHMRTYSPKDFATVDEPLWQITDLYIPYDRTEAKPGDDVDKNVALKQIIGVLNKAKI
jgi:hypothetical protein